MRPRNQRSPRTVRGSMTRSMIVVTAAKRYAARKTNTYGRSMSVPTSRRRNPIASTIPLALAAEEALEEAARRLADAAPAEERARHGSRELRVGAHVGPADRPARAERDGEPAAGVHQHGPRLRLAED